MEFHGIWDKTVVRVRVCAAWKKWRVMASLLTNKRTPLKT